MYIKKFGGKEMFIVSQKVKVELGNEADFITAIKERHELRAQAGFIDLTIARSTDDDSTFLITGRWEYREAHDAWETSQLRERVEERNTAAIETAETGTYMLLDTI